MEHTFTDIRQWWARTAASIYLYVPCVATIIGTVAVRSRSSNALNAPLLMVLFAIAGIVTARGLALRMNIARLAFFILAPMVTLGASSAWSPVLWRDDAPYTVLLVVVYTPICFILSRGYVLHSFAVAGASWRERGGLVVALCAILAFMAREMTAAAPISADGNGLTGMYTYLTSANEHVKRIVTCSFLFVFYAGAVLAVSIPTSSETATEECHVDHVS